MMAYPPSLRARAVALYRRKVAVDTIADRFSVHHTTVRRWARDAGCDARVGGRAYPKAVRDRALKLYATLSSAAVAKKVGVSPRLVSLWARASGVPPGKRDMHHHEKYVRDLAVKQYRAGVLSVTEIAETLKVDRHAVRAWARAAGCPPRPGNHRQHRKSA